MNSKELIRMPAQASGIEQQTPVWTKARIGSVTASRVPDVMAKLRDMNKESSARYNYKMEVIIEQLTGRATEHYQSEPMRWGLETQGLAAAAYEMDQRIFLSGGGYWRHDTIENFGASPDYLVGTDGLLECKCPTTPTHLNYLLTGEVPECYLWQMTAQMAVTGRQWCDFCSFDPRLPEQMQLFVKRFDRTQSLISAVEVEVRQFLKEVKDIVSQLKSRK